MNSPSFESPDHQRQFSQQLHARRTAGKFMFAGSGVALHERLVREHPEDYDNGRAAEEFACLVRAISGDLPRQVCDIGTSNGVHTKDLLTLYARLQSEYRVLGLDFSRRMLDIARVRLETLLAPLQLDVWDVEQGATRLIERWRADGPVVACLLGNTLGNLDAPQVVLQNVAQSLRPADLLIVSFYLRSADDGSADVEYYERSDIRELIAEPLRAAGLSTAEAPLELRWHADAVVGEVRLMAAKRVLGVELKQAERIKCFMSRRHDEEHVRAMLAAAGWQTLAQNTSGTRAVLVARRR